MDIIIHKSSKKDKKYDAVINGRKTVSFGAKGYEDSTVHHDPKRKENYINRHKTDEDWSKSGVTSAGWLSRFILWNKPTLKASVEDANKKYKDVKFKIK